MDNEIVVEEHDLSELKPHPNNPRYIDERALSGLAASLERFGVVEPIVWNRRTGFVVGGHQRLKVLESKGVTTTRVVVVDLDEQEELALNVTLNNPNIAGAFNEDVAEILMALDDELGEEFKRLGLDLLADQHVGEQVDDPLGEWTGMPEFKQKDERAFRSIHVHFPDADAITKFEKLIGKQLPEKARHIWFPEMAVTPEHDMRYAAEDDGDGEPSVPPVHPE